MEDQKEEKKEELPVLKEEPLEIQDYTATNDWEKLVKEIEVELLKWTGYVPKEMALKRVASEILTGVALEVSDSVKAFPQRPIERSVLDNKKYPFARYYAEGMKNLLDTKRVWTNDTIRKLFGVHNYYCEDFPYGNVRSIESLLSALQLATENKSLEWPVFARAKSHSDKHDIYKGYLDWLALYTKFDTHCFSDFTNGLTRYNSVNYILQDLVNNRKIIPAIPSEHWEIPARHQHYLDMSGQSVIINYLILSSHQSKHSPEGKIKLLGNHWGEFILNSEQITLSINCKNSMKKFKKIFFYLMDNFYRSQKLIENSLISMPQEFGEIEQKHLEDVEIYRKNMENKWRKYCDRAVGARKPSCLNKLRPCCMFSYYGALLNHLFDTRDLGVWQLFIRSLRDQWETHNQFAFCELESPVGYSSNIYSELQNLLRASIVFRRINSFLKQAEEEEIEEEPFKLSSLSRCVSETYISKSEEPFIEKYHRYNARFPITLYMDLTPLLQHEWNYIFQRTESHEERERYFDKIVRSMMIQFYYTSLDEEPNLSNFLEYTEAISVNYSIINKIIKLFSRESLEKLWGDKQHIEHIKEVFVEIEGGVEKAFEYLESIHSQELIMDIIKYKSYEVMVKAASNCNTLPEECLPFYSQSALSQMKIFVRDFSQLESKAQSVSNLQGIILLVEKNLEYIQKLQTLSRLYCHNISDPIIGEAIQALSLNNTFSTTQKDKFVLLYTPKLHGLPLLEISGPDIREYILTYLDNSKVIPCPCRIYIEVCRNSLYVATAQTSSSL